jgi:septum formation protein
MAVPESNKTRQLVLASASPRRRELLDSLSVTFSCRPVDLDETALPGESPEDYVRRLACAKADSEAHEGELILAADTIVVLDGELLGKPQDPDDARRMLRRLAGCEHQVLTGVAVHIASRLTRSEVCRSSVRIAPLSDEEIAWYVSTGEPADKAGAYAIQGLGALLVESIEGNYSNVVGLPLPSVQQLFREIGYDLRDFRRLADPAVPETPR